MVLSLVVNSSRQFMKPRHVLLIFLSLLIFTAFKNKSTRAEARIKKTVSFLRPQDSTAYTYTSSGKILTYNGYWSQMWQTFEYTVNKVIERGEGTIKSHPYTNIFYLNKQQKADSMIRIANGDTFCFYFRYNKAGFRIEELSGCKAKVTERKRIIEDGNVVKQIFFENGTETEVGYFEYYQDKSNQPTMFGEEQLGFTFRGRDSKNLLKKIVLVRGDNDTVLVNTPSYHFDAKGRISVVAIYGKSGALADSVFYGY
jgi:hypothetical protein